MTKEQVRLKAEEIVNTLSINDDVVRDLRTEQFIINAMLEFGVYIEELTKQRCLENAKIKNIDTFKREKPTYKKVIDKDSILEIPNLCSNET